LCQWRTIAGSSGSGSSLAVEVEPAVPVADAEDGAHAVELPEPDDELPDDGVRAGAEPAAGDDGRAHAGRVERDLAGRPGAVVGCEGAASGGRGGGVEEDVAEDDVGGGDEEGRGRVVERVARDGVGDGGGASVASAEVVGEGGEPVERERRQPHLAAAVHGRVVFVSRCVGVLVSVGGEVRRAVTIRCSIARACVC
jgi:hypothetical protein